LPSNNALYSIPVVNVVALPFDGNYIFRIDAYDRSKPLWGNWWYSGYQNYQVDTRAPIAGGLTSPKNDLWVQAKKPTFNFTAANDNWGFPGFSNVYQYTVRVWWDNTNTAGTIAANSIRPAAFPATNPSYKDYNVGTATSWTIPDDLNDGRYYWDVWVCDTAGNWRWFFNPTTGNYSTSGTNWGNTAMPGAVAQRFQVDTTAPTTNGLVSEINDVWITTFKPAFTWKAGSDLLKADGVTLQAGSGNNRYELYLWGPSGGTPAIYTVSCAAAPGNAAYNANITTTPVYSVLWLAPLGIGAVSQLITGRYFWDIKLVDNAGNYKWYKSGIINAPASYNFGTVGQFRVDGVPPEAGVITWPKSNQWIDQTGTRFVDGSGIVSYSPNKKPDLKFTAARDLQSGLQKYKIILKDSTMVTRGEEVLTPIPKPGCTSAPALFALAYQDPYIFVPQWGTGTWAVELKDGQYFWQIEVTDNTGVNTTYYSTPTYEKFRLDTVAPKVAMTGIGELLSPSYGYIATTSVNLINFKWSRSLDDVGAAFNGVKIPDETTPATLVGSGISRYSFVLATNREKLKVHANVDIWESGYVIATSPVVLTLNYSPFLNDTLDAELNALTSANTYWSVYVKDYAGNESQYVDRKLRIRHIPPNPGHLIEPPHGTVTTNRKLKFKWTQ